MMPRLDIWGKPIEPLDPRGFYSRLGVGGEVSELGPYPLPSAAVSVANGMFPTGSTYELCRMEGNEGGLTMRVVARLVAAKDTYRS